MSVAAAELALDGPFLVLSFGTLPAGSAEALTRLAEQQIAPVGLTWSTVVAAAAAALVERKLDAVAADLAAATETAAAAVLVGVGTAHSVPGAAVVAEASAATKQPVAESLHFAPAACQ